MSSSVFLAELSLTEVEDYLRRNDLVFVPTGATEQHGPHSPLCTDVIIPTEVSRRVALRLDAIVAPTVAYGLSAEHRGFCGLAYVSGPTFISVIEDITFSLAEAGFRRIVFVNGHATNYHAIPIACMNVAHRLPAGTRAWGVSYWDALPLEQREEYLGLSAGGHANIGETSAVLAVRPELVDLHAAVAEWPDFPIFQAPARPVLEAYFQTHPASNFLAFRTGVWGDPSGSSAELGEKFYGWFEEAMVKLVADVDETYRRLSASE